MALKLSVLLLPLATAFTFMHSSYSWKCTRMKGIAARDEVTTSSLQLSTPDDHEHPIIVTGVTLKMAFDSSPIWGVADLSETKSERFTSSESLDMVHRLRRASSAVLVGRGTVERDDCSLTVRRVKLGEGQEQPVRVILDPSLSLVGGDFAIFNDGLRTLVYHSQSANINHKALSSSSESVSFVPMSPLIQEKDGMLSLSPLQIVQDLASRGLTHIMVEGGPTTARAFLHAGVVDRAILIRAPLKFQIPVPAQMDESTMMIAGLNMVGKTEMGCDVVEYWTRDGMQWPNRNNLSSWP